MSDNDNPDSPPRFEDAFARFEASANEVHAAAERETAKQRALDELHGAVAAEWERWRQRGYSGIEFVALSCLQEHRMDEQLLRDAELRNEVNLQNPSSLFDAQRIPFPADVSTDTAEVTTDPETMTALFGPNWPDVARLVRSVHTLPEAALLRIPPASESAPDDDSRQAVLDELSESLGADESGYADRSAEAAFVSVAWRCGADPGKPEQLGEHTLAVAAAAHSAVYATCLAHRLGNDDRALLLGPWTRMCGQ